MHALAKQTPEFTYNQAHRLTISSPKECIERNVVVQMFQNHVFNDPFISIQLTDPDDVCFLYTASMTEDNFNVLKQQQGLLVDFANFIHKVTELLELCEADDDKPPRYSLKLFIAESGEATLCVIEATNFKYLTHLALDLKKGDDQKLLSYLEGYVNKLKQEITQKSQLISNFSEQLSLRDQEIVHLQVGLDEVNKQLRIRSEEQLTLLRKAASDETAKLDELEGRLRAAHEAERQRLTDANQAEITNLRAQLDRQCSAAQHSDQMVISLQSRFDDLTRERSRLESRISELEQLNTSHIRDNAVLTDQIASLKLQCETAQSSERELLEKFVKLEAEYRSLTDSRKGLQEEAQKKSRRVDKLEKLISTQNGDISRANEIIGKLQQEVKSLQAKSRTLSHLAAEQEKAVSSREVELADLRTSHEQLRASLETRITAFDAQAAKLAESQAYCSQLQQALATNEEMVNWLNRQLTAKQLAQMQTRFRCTTSSALNKSPQAPPVATSRAEEEPGGVLLLPPAAPAPVLTRPPKAAPALPSHNISEPPFSRAVMPVVSSASTASCDDATPRPANNATEPVWQPMSRAYVMGADPGSPSSAASHSNQSISLYQQQSLSHAFFPATPAK